MADPVVLRLYRNETERDHDQKAIQDVLQAAADVVTTEAGSGTLVARLGVLKSALDRVPPGIGTAPVTATGTGPATAPATGTEGETR